MTATKCKKHKCKSPAPTPPSEAREASNDEVICPACVHQFRAIPVNVQAELTALRAQVQALEWRLKNAGICELAVDNVNLASYMNHWEGRALKAEQATRAGLDRAIALVEHGFDGECIGRDAVLAVLRAAREEA